MKTIEERAREFAHEYRRKVHDLNGKESDVAFTAFIAGAESEHEELTRWNDPKEVLPEDCMVVLTRKKVDHACSYLTAAYSTELCMWVTPHHDAAMQCGLPPLNVTDYRPDGWREIH